MRKEYLDCFSLLDELVDLNYQIGIVKRKMEKLQEEMKPQEEFLPRVGAHLKSAYQDLSESESVLIEAFLHVEYEIGKAYELTSTTEEYQKSLDADGEKLEELPF